MWSSTRNRCQSVEDKRKDFSTFALDLVKHATGHRPKISEEIEEHEMKKEPWKLVPRDSSIRSRQEGTAVLLCGDSTVDDLVRVFLFCLDSGDTLLVRIAPPCASFVCSEQLSTAAQVQVPDLNAAELRCVPGFRQKQGLFPPGAH